MHRIPLIALLISCSEYELQGETLTVDGETEETTEGGGPPTPTTTTTTSGTTPTATQPGEALQPALVLAPPFHDFGAVTIGAAGYVELTVTNEGDGNGEVTGLELITESESELVIHSWGDLVILPHALAPGESAAFEVRYTPLDEAIDTATVAVAQDSGGDLTAELTGAGLPAEPDPVDYEIELMLTADDALEAYIDGVDVTGPNASGWSGVDTVTTTLSSGEHVIAVHAWDVATVISGFIAGVWIDGAAADVTGDGSWLVSTSPDSGWEDVGFDDSGWSTPAPCSDTSPWGGAPISGADWVWWTSDCRALGEGWFRLNLSLP